MTECNSQVGFDFGVSLTIVATFDVPTISSDGGLLLLGSGEHEYTDSFYKCNDSGKAFVDGIDQVFSSLGALAK